MTAVSPEPVLAIEDLTIRYGKVTAVDGLTLDVFPGEVLGLLGGNGAGKSSTLRAVAGVNPHSAGTLKVSGWDMASPAQAEKARSAVGFCPDVGGLIRQATVREHIALALAFRRKTHLWPQALELAELFDLTDVIDRVTQGFSHGMTRRLSVMLATLTADDILVLDEPFDGVDPLGVEATMKAINLATTAGLGVLISTHLLDLVVESCDRVAVMVGGTVVENSPASAFTGTDGKTRYANLLRKTA